MNQEAITNAIPWLALVVLSLPLLSSLFNLIIKDKFAWLSPIVSTLFLLGTTISAFVLYFRLFNKALTEYSWAWLTIDDKIIDASIFLDGNSLIMILAVSIVSLLVHVFSLGYMAEDHAPARYFGMLGFFTFTMLGLVMSGNLLFTFIFWELVGFSSYRLIGHWYEKPAAARASLKAFLLNRVGDLGFLIGLMMLWSLVGHLNYFHINFTSLPPELLTLAGLCIFLAVMGKSAQFPLFHWLPDAMEGPTPVSALIHAATMVAAGVYMLARFSLLFTHEVLSIISITGMVTALIGAWGALVQYEIKKILAYSTISQLGLMVMAIGAGAYGGGFLHLLHHAFFKAGLFLGAGAVIHAMHQAYHHQEDAVDVQDIRNLGGLRKKLPVTFLSFIICASALAGLPFTSGFVSKELILSKMTIWAGNEITWKWIVIAGAWIVTFLTPVYTFRLVWFIFFAKPKHSLELEEVPVIMRTPLILLAFLSISMIFYTFSGHLFSIINLLINYYPDTDTTLTIISVAVIAVAVLSSYYYYKKSRLQNLPVSLSPQYYLDFITQKVIILNSKLSSFTEFIDKKIFDPFIHFFAYLGVIVAHLTGWADKNIIDGLVNGTAWSTKGLGAMARIMINGKIQSYLLWAIAALLIFILWILY